MNKTLSFDETCKKWEDFLKSSPLHFIKIKRGFADEKGTYLRGQHPNATTRIHAEDVFRNHTSFEEYLTGKIKANGLEKITIFPAKKNGTGTVPVTTVETKNYNVAGILKKAVESSIATPEASEEKPMETTPQIPHNRTVHPEVTPSQPQPYYPPTPHISHNGLGAAALNAVGGLGAAAHAAGMGFNELSDLKATAKLYEKLLADFEDLKKKYNLAEIENQTLKGKVEIAEQQKEVAIQLEQASKSGFFESAAGQKMMEALPAMFEMIGNRAGGQTPQGLGAPTGLSEAKSEFINYLSDPHVTDNMMMPLTTVMYHMANTKGYLMNLQNFNQEYGNQQQSV